MEVNVESESQIPLPGSNFINYFFKDMKVSFIVLLSVIILIYIMIFMLVGNNSSQSNATSSIMGLSNNIIVIGLELMLWIFLIFIIYVNIKNYDDKGMDFQAKITNLFNKKIAELDINVKNLEDQDNKQVANDNAKNDNDKNDNKQCENSDSDSNKEVFHIAHNVFDYEEAQNICKSYNARLATYDEIENAYNQGANWCSYGWSDDQMAFFPIQKKLYNELKKISGHENDCGRPGVNGGFVKDKKLKFGANCYGIKPKPKEIDKKYTHAINHSPALDKDQAELDSMNIHNKYVVAPFNRDKWSKL